MIITETTCKDLVIIEPKVFGDERGYFIESFNEIIFNKKVSITHFIQDNESKSTYGVLRGLHIQQPPYTQAKLVRVVSGEVLDVAVDLRTDSPTFRQHFSLILTGENKKQLFIPRGFAHGFAVLSEAAVFQYKVDNYYSAENEAGILYSDDQLAIDWILNPRDMILSQKDKMLPKLESFKYFNTNDYHKNS